MGWISLHPHPVRFPWPCTSLSVDRWDTSWKIENSHLHVIHTVSHSFLLLLEAVTSLLLFQSLQSPHKPLLVDITNIVIGPDLIILWSLQGWEKFTDAVIRWINTNLHGVVFLLWGSYAQKKGSFIDKVQFHRFSQIKIFSSVHITYGMIWSGEIFVVTPIYIGLKFSSFSSLSGK